MLSPISRLSVEAQGTQGLLDLVAIMTPRCGFQGQFDSACRRATAHVEAGVCPSLVESVTPVGEKVAEVALDVTPGTAVLLGMLPYR
jgi:hypothetical protein